MVIYRNGQEIELTEEECRCVYTYMEQQYRRDDIGGMLENMEITFLTPYDVDLILQTVENRLANHDTYWDCYWAAIEDCVADYVKKYTPTKQQIYDEMSKVLTDWETQDAVDDDLYNMLVKIQRNWENVITKQEV